MAFPKFHGITLAQNAWIENASVERLAVDPVAATAGRFWFNTATKQMKYSGLDGGGAVATYVLSTAAELQAAIDSIDTLAGRVTAVEGAYVKKDGSVAFTGNVDAGNNKVVNVATGVAGTDAVNVTQLSDAIASLASAFNYIGTVEGGANAGAAFDLATLTAKTAGSYYKVTTSGFFVLGAGTPFQANLNDGLVFNTTAGVDIVDNTNSTVSGTAGFVAVTGSPDTGFVVDIDTAFKTSVSDAAAAIVAETNRATAAEGVNATAIAAEATRAGNAEGVLTTAIADEATRAGNAEGVLTTAISTEASARSAADADLTTAISDEVTRATTAESTLGTAITTEATTRANADTALTTAISDEVTRATTAEGVNAAAIAAEVTRATTAEDVNVAAISELDTRVGPLASLTTSDKGSIVEAINEVKDLAGSGSDALRVAINNQRFTYLASAPALTHVVEHNLNTGFPNFTSWVKGDDTVFRNDIVAVEETDSNTLTVTLTESRIIKVVVQAMDNIVNPT